MNQTTKNFAQTTKPSYNNSPVNRQKNGAVIVGGYQQNLNPANNKRQQQVRQQPIGQPMGDNTGLAIAQQDLEYQSNTFYANQSS